MSLLNLWDKRDLGVLGKALTLSVLALAWSTGCKAKTPQITAPFSDDFERAEAGPRWNDTGGGYQIVGGNLNVKGAYNHPLWLRQQLPRDVKVSLDVMSKSAAGDIKVELFGDGESFDPDKGGYLATGYVFIMGGWNNQLSVLCRQNEHNEGVKAKRSDFKVEPGRMYHVEITRKGGLLQWRIDGENFLSWEDADPLYGAGNQYFAFNNWESDVYFDNLKIEPL